MRFLLLVCTAALLLSVTVAEDDPPKRDELEEQKSPSPPKADEPEAATSPPKADEPEAAKTPPKEDDPEAATSPPKEDEEDDSKSPPKEDEADDSKSPPKEDDPEVIRFPSEYGSMGNRVAQANPYPRRYWTNRRNQQEQAIGRMAKRISEMQRNYALSKAKNMTLAAKMEAFNKKLYDVTMDLRRAEQQIENCKDVDTGNPLIPQRNVNSPSIGPVYTFRYIRLLRYLRVNIDRELTAVTNLKWSREKGK